MNLHTVRVMIKLLPSVLALRRDRRRWAGRETDDKAGKPVNIAAFRSNAQRLLDTLISLGPVYIKLGQWLSSRADILPHPYLEVLAKLQDEVPAAPFHKVRATLEREVGPLEKAFDTIDENPISGASLGQVYRATRNGIQMAVKVKRPGIQQAVNRDIKVIKKILPLALRFVDVNLRHSAKAMLAQFVESIHEEMDYTIESKNLKRIKRDMAASNHTVVVPSVIDDLSTRDVLTMEYIPGIKVTNIKLLDKIGIDRQKLVIDVHKIFFTMLLKHSVFHADPHPGNISVTDDGRLILYDYGMVGRLDNETRLRLVRLYLALVEKDPARTVSAMYDLGMLAPGANREVIEKGIEMTIRAMYGRKPDEMEVDSLMEMANRTMSRFPFVLPKNLALYIRMASIIEGIYKTHGVDFKFVRVLREILEEENLVKDAYIEEAKRSITRFVKSIDATIALAPELRRHLDELRSTDHTKRRRGASPGTILLSGAVFSGAMFVGSAFMHASGANAMTGTAGLVGSVIVMGAFAAGAAIVAKRAR